MKTCPHCGRAIEINIAKPASHYGVPWKPFYPMADSARRIGDVAQPVETPSKPTEYTRRSQSRAPNRDADVGVPFFRTLGTAVFVGAPLALWIAWGNKYPVRDFFIVWATVGGASWLIFTGLSEASIWVFEKIINRDIDGDGYKGRPPVVVKASLHQESDEEDHWTLADLPAPSWEYLQVFARDILDGHTTFSERGAADYGYSQAMFRQLRDKFISAHWAIWRDPEHHEQGVHLLSGGRAILQQIADK